jgi:hypothetical protein
MNITMRGKGEKGKKEETKVKHTTPHIQHTQTEGREREKDIYMRKRKRENYM